MEVIERMVEEADADNDGFLGYISNLQFISLDFYHHIVLFCRFDEFCKVMTLAESKQSSSLWLLTKSTALAQTATGNLSQSVSSDQAAVGRAYDTADKSSPNQDSGRCIRIFHPIVRIFHPIPLRDHS